MCFCSAYQLLPHQNAQLKPPLKRMDAAPVPYENLKDSFEVEVAANGENGDSVVGEAAVMTEDPFRTDHIDVQKLVSPLQAPDSPAVPLRRRKVVAAFGSGFCVYRKVTS